jgi:hypothetical protein
MIPQFKIVVWLSIMGVHFRKKRGVLWQQ